MNIYHKKLTKSIVDKPTKLFVLLIAVFASGNCFAQYLRAMKGNGNDAEIVEKQAEFVLKNKEKIASFIETSIKMFESEKYKDKLIKFAKAKEYNGPPIEEFILYRALEQLGQSPFDLVVEGDNALGLRKNTQTVKGKLSKTFIIPYDPGHINAFLTGYQLSPSALEKSKEAVDFLIPLYEVLLDTLIEEFEDFEDSEFWHSMGARQTQGFLEKFNYDIERLDSQIQLEAFFPLLIALPSGMPPHKHFGPSANITMPINTDYFGKEIVKVNLDQLKFMKKIFKFKEQYGFYLVGKYNHDFDGQYTAIREAIEKKETEVTDFSDLESTDEGTDEDEEESPTVEFEDLNL